MLGHHIFSGKTGFQKQGQHVGTRNDKLETHEKCLFSLLSLKNDKRI